MCIRDRKCGWCCTGRCCPKVQTTAFEGWLGSVWDTGTQHQRAKNIGWLGCHMSYCMWEVDGIIWLWSWVSVNQLYCLKWHIFLPRMSVKALWTPRQTTTILKTPWQTALTLKNRGHVIKCPLFENFRTISLKKMQLYFYWCVLSCL